MVNRQRFTAEFQREAVHLLDVGEKPASEVGIDLEISAIKFTTGRLSIIAPDRRHSKALDASLPIKIRRLHTSSVSGYASPKNGTS